MGRAEPEDEAPLLEQRVREVPATGDVATIRAALEEDGVVLLRGLFTAARMEEFGEAYRAAWAKTQAALGGGEWVRRVYTRMEGPTFNLDKSLYHKVAHMEVPQGGEGAKTEVIRMGKGRYDFSHGMEGTVLDSDLLLRPEPVRSVLSSFLGAESEWLSYTGGLPVEGARGPGRWHRDTYSLWEETGASDAAMPPWYFTMVAPLTSVGRDEGMTQFRLGSHLVPPERVHAMPVGAPARLEPGDALLFDGRVVHRGGRCTTAASREALYCVYHKFWYTDDDAALVGKGYVEVEPVPAAEVAQMEAEEPWLRGPPRPRRRGGANLALPPRWALGLALALALGFRLGRSSRR